jgi:hypothetical protein
LPNSRQPLATFLALVVLVLLGLGSRLLGPHGGLVITGSIIVGTLVPRGATGLMVLGLRLGLGDLELPGTRNGSK